MNVPFLDLKAQHSLIYDEIMERITDILKNTAFILGKHVEEFEEGFGGLHGADYCLGVSSGTDALHVALLALGIGPGDEVIVPVNTFIATAEAVSLTGARPVFVDCDEYYNMDVEKVRYLIEESEAKSQESEAKSQKSGVRSQEAEVRSQEAGVKIRGIIPVHLYGQPANMEKVMELARKNGLRVIEDACQAHLAQYQGKLVGNFGEFGAFSFYPGKNLGAYGEAGALITNDQALYENARMLRQHGESERYHHQIIGHNYRMEAIQGAVLSTKLKYIENWTEMRRGNARLYNDLLSDIEGVRTPGEIEDTYCVYHLYVIQTDDRDGLREFLHENGVSTGLHYPIPLHLQEAYSHLGYKKGDFPIAEKAADRILSLPMYPELTEAQISYVCDKIREFFG